jgi:hypothetical protein
VSKSLHRGRFSGRLLARHPESLPIHPPELTPVLQRIARIPDPLSLALRPYDAEATA